MSTLTLENFRGGYSTNDERNLKDNQLTEALNLVYGANGKLQTAPGYATFGDPVSSSPFTSLFFHKMDDGTRVLLGTEGTNLRRYNETTSAWDLVTATNWLTKFDSRKVLHTCDSVSTNGTWAGTDDVTDVAADTSEKKQGDGSIRFKLDTGASGANQAVLTNSTMTAVDLTNYLNTGKIRMWAQIPGSSNFTEFELRWGSDASNYWSKTVSARVDGSGLSGGDTTVWNFIEFDWATATMTGTPTVSAIDYLQILFKYNGSYSFPAPASRNAGIDFIAIYATDDTAGDLKTLWDFSVYKNSVYMTNGVDPYISYDYAGSGTVSILGGPGGRYIEYLQDRLCIGGDDLFPHRLNYTNANPTNGDENAYVNALDIGADDTYSINAMREIGQSVVIGKSEKSYNVDFTNEVALPIDATGGMFGNRAVVPVGNALLYQSKRGIESLQAKQATANATAVETDILSEPIQELMGTISVRTRRYSNAIYVRENARYYFTFDTDNDGIPETTVIYSALEETQSFTLRNLPPIFHYTEYEDSDGNIKYLFASATGGQVYEFETGIDDNGISIESVMATKVFDFDTPEVINNFEYVSIFGRKNEGGEIEAEILVDGETVSTTTIDDTFVILSEPADAIGTEPIGTEPIGGSSSALSEVFKIKIPIYFLGTTIQIKMRTGEQVTFFSPERITIVKQGQELSYFPFANIA